MKVLLASSIDPGTVARLREAHEVVTAFGAPEAELIAAVEGCQALVFRSGVEITAGVLDAATDLTVIVRAGSGYDNIDLEPVRRRGIRFIRVPGPGAKAVAELAFAQMLALARNLFWADREWRAGNWVKTMANGRLLTGKTLGVVGAGNIGSRVGAMGAAWGMRALGCVEHPTETAARRLAERGIELTDLDRILAEADFVSIHTPLQASTRNLIGADALGKMKPGSYLVTLARGGVVDEGALRAALESGHLAGAALDVHEREGNGNVSPLAGLPNVILTPHIGASTSDSQAEIGQIILECIQDAVTRPPDLVPGVEDFVVIGA